MRYIIRPIVSNILLFIESLLLILITLTFSLKITLLNQNSVLKQLKKTDYYEKVNDEIIDTMKYITRKTGYKDYIVEDIYSKEDIKNDINKFVNSLYKNNELNLNTEHLKENLENNLEKYLEEKGKEPTGKEKEYIKKIESTYKNEVLLMDQMKENSKTISSYNKTISCLMPIFIIDFIVLLIINKMIFNKKEYHVIALTSAISLTAINIFTKTLNFKNLFIYNDNVSQVIKKLINNAQFVIIIFIILYIILGTILFIKSNKEKKEIYE